MYLDLLGFSDLVQKKSADEVYSTIADALESFHNWNKINPQFGTIYFSDTFILYQRKKGYGDWAFLDIYAISAMLLASLLAQGIAARGAISFGEFEVSQDPSGGHQICFGKALVEAYRAEQSEDWLGIVVLESAWSPYEAGNPGMVSVSATDGTWLQRHDGVLLLNPLERVTGWYDLWLVGDIDRHYTEWDAPDFPNGVQALRFLLKQSELFESRGDYTGRVARKYHLTLLFLRNILGEELFDWVKGLGDGTVPGPPDSATQEARLVPPHSGL